MLLEVNAQLLWVGGRRTLIQRTRVNLVSFPKMGTEPLRGVVSHTRPLAVCIYLSNEVLLPWTIDRA